MFGLLKRANSGVSKFVRKWGDLRASDGAVLIAWQLLFSLFPLVLGLLSILGLVLRDPETLESVVTLIVNQFPEQATELLGFMAEARELGGILGVISIVGLLWTGSNLFGVTASVFNRLYAASDRSYISQRLVDYGIMIVYAVLITVSVGASSITGVLVGISRQVIPIDIPYFAFVLGWLISFVSAALMFLVLYRVVPNAPLSFRDVWPGGLLSAVLFVILTQVFPIYLRYLGGGFATYKALGVFLLLMTWFYFLANILVAGALLNAMLRGYQQQRTTDAGMSASETRQSPGGSKGQRQPSPNNQPDAQDGRPAAHDNGHGPFKVVAWAGLTAAVTSLLLISARALAGRVWRVLVGEAPPR